MNSFIDFDFKNKKIIVSKRMPMIEVYSRAKDVFVEPEHMVKAFPLVAVWLRQYVFKDGWDFVDEKSKKNITHSFWSYDGRAESWNNVMCYGELNNNIQLEYRIDKDKWIAFSGKGLVNEAILCPPGAKEICVKIEGQNPYRGKFFKARIEGLIAGAIYNG